MPTKNRLLVLLQTLQKNTDDETWLTTANIRSALEAEGIDCYTRTLCRDIQSLYDCSFDIEVRETEGGFTNREWSKLGLQIIVDVVSDTQFILQTRSEELIRKLSVMAVRFHADKLKPQIVISEHIKTKIKSMIYSVQTIQKAIERDRKISFLYLQ